MAALIQYSLTFINASSTPGTACLYQTAPAGLQSLAWLVRGVTASGGEQPTASFTWSLSYGFMYMETENGSGFAEIANADPVLTNQTTFSMTDSGYAFSQPTQGTVPGTLTITEMSNVTGDVLVGFAMAESPMLGAAAPSSTLTYVTSPTPTYMLAFGAFTPGQVIPASLSNPTPIPIIYPENVYALTATLSPLMALSFGPA